MQVTPLLRRLAAKDAGGPLGRAAAAVLCVAFALAVRFAVEPLLRGEMAYVTFFPAVVVAALWAGRWAGLCAVGLSIAAVWTFVDVDRTLAPWVEVCAFGGSSGFLVLAAGALRDTVRALDRSLAAEAESAEALKAGEARFRGVFQSGAIGVAIADMAGDRPVEVNDRFLEIVGVDRAVFAAGGWDWRDATPPDHISRDEAATRALLKTGRPQSFEKDLVRPDGTRVPVTLTAALMPDFPGLAVITVQDVSDTRRAEAAMAESEARFRSMADTAPTPIWVSDADGALEYGNAAFRDFSGRAPETVAGLWWREVIHPADADAAGLARDKARQDRAPYTMEQRLKDKDGVWRWYSVHGRPRFAEDGAFLGFVGISFEITETKRAQETLEQLNDELEHRVRRALADKEHAEAALLQSQKLEAIGRLTGGVAHDFNNLLTVVIGSLDSILRKGDDPVRRTRMAEAALQAARRGERLTQQLLAFARRQALRPETADVGALVRESEPLLRRAVGEAVELSFRVPDAPLHVRIDPAQFEAALMNLVVNAKDATADGGRIRVDVWSRRFEAGEVGDGPAGDYVCIEVADTGAGMAPEVLARVFEPFFTTKPVGKGTGLGLAQVYGFARQSGGDADVYSAPGQGTRVALRLPKVAPGARKAAERPAAPPASVDGMSVLLVEDDPEVGQLAEALLTDQGCTVARAASAEPALELLRGGARFDVLLTDVIMPGGVNGVELARQAAALRPELSIVLTSGYVGEALDGTLADAPWPLLRKPYTAEQLVEALGASVRAVEAA